MKTPPIFVISLARAADRRADMIRRLEADGLQYEIVDAVDGQKINLADYADRLGQDHRKEGSRFRYSKDSKYPATRALGEIGCYLSHYNLWQRIADERIPMAIIFEDDAIWNADFAAVVATAAATDWRWDLIELHIPRPRTHRIMQSLHGDYKLVRSLHANDDAAAYMISLSGAKKLVKHGWFMHSTNSTIWRDYWNYDGCVLGILPSVAGVSEVQTTKPGNRGKKMHPLSWYMIRRVLRRWQFFATRRWFYHFRHPQK